MLHGVPGYAEGVRMLMREVLGKIVSIRPEPTVMKERIGTLEPGETVTAVGIVDDLQHPGDPEYRWLELPDGTYVNYIHPPAGLRFNWVDAPQGPTFPFDLYRVKWDFQMYPYGFASRPAAFQRLKPHDHTLLEEMLQKLWFEQIRIEGQGLTDEQLRQAWRWLTASDRFITNGQGPDVRRDYILGLRLDEQLPGIFPLASAGNVLRGKVERDREEYLAVDTLTPGMTFPSDLSYAKHPWWIHYATTTTGRKLMDGTYLCNPFSTKTWVGRNAPHPVISSEPVRIEMRFLDRIPAGTPVPSPYNPPRYRVDR